jgi:APA family basic amino acid/polyamine antiporter
MFWKQLFARKSLERLLAEMEGENRLRRVLGPIALTALGVGAIIGSGIFVTTGETAATKAGPSVMLSYVVAGIGCLLAALCYAEFASMAPVAGSAYTYAYATLGELMAWIIGWDLVLEYAMSCGVVAADWTKYFNELLEIVFSKNWRVPEFLSNDPFTLADKGFAWGFNLPAVIVMALITVVLVIGIRESAVTNALLVATKVGVVIFVVVVGWHYVNPDNWTKIPVEKRLPITVSEYLERNPEVARLIPEEKHRSFTNGQHLLREYPAVADKLSEEELTTVKGLKSDAEKWGMMTLLGLDKPLHRLDDRTRSPFMPFGITGILVASAAVFFAYIGFDAVSTHAEEARKPRRDVPIGILASLAVCTILYLGVSAVITGMEPYYDNDQEAAVAVAFKRLAQREQSTTLHISAGIIATGALAGMTSVILISLLSQARIFLAMARDGLLPAGVFGAVHPRFRTPHLSTMLTGGLLCFITAVTPINVLFNMVNIGTLLAFIIVCAAVLILRLTRPEAERPFRCPGVYLVAPLGIGVNLLMMMFLPLDSWLRLVGWLLIGMVIYFGYGFRRTVMAREQWRQQLGKEGTPEEAYFASSAYRRRVRFSLWFCAVVVVLSTCWWATAEFHWQHGTLAERLTFEPLTIVWIARAFTAFTVFMLLSNVVEWRKLRTAG